MIKDLVNPTNFNLMVSKISDILVKALDQPLGYAINWGRIWSLWPVHLETACCSVEFGAASGPRYDVERFGIIEAFGSLRQCDLIVVQGTVNRKMAPRLRMVYDQINMSSDPKEKPINSSAAQSSPSHPTPAKPATQPAKQEPEPPPFEKEI